MKSYFTQTPGWSISKRETRHFINQVTIQQQKLFGNGHMHPSSLHAFLDSFQTLLWHLMMASQKVMFLLLLYYTDKGTFYSNKLIIHRKLYVFYTQTDRQIETRNMNYAFM